MIPISAASRILLRGMVIVYLLLFAAALFSSAFLLKEILGLKPIPMIGLLKYLLLCVLFVILLANTLKAFTLAPQHVGKFYRSTTNFKWLFLIALLISVIAKLGLFDTALHKQTAVTNIQIAILLVTGIFCFWSDAMLYRIHSRSDLL